MSKLRNDKVLLRPLEPEDIDFVLSVENDEAYWKYSSTEFPFSKHLIKQYLNNAHLDIYTAKQFRFVICDNNEKELGLIDLFDFDFKNKRAGLGVIIKDELNRGKGYAFSALKLIIEYCKSHLNIHQVYCNILSENNKSIALFEKLDFINIGKKKDWIYYDNRYHDEILYQLILK
jgi:diamine N-acetyltransferase